MDDSEIMTAGETGLLDGWTEPGAEEVETGAGGDARIPADGAGAPPGQGAAGGDGALPESGGGVPGPADVRRQADLRAFTAQFPDAARDPWSIPGAVWAEVRAGRSLTEAYAGYRAAQARRAAVLRQNEENAARAVGSMRSAGADDGARDPFLQGFFAE